MYWPQHLVLFASVVFQFRCVLTWSSPIARPELYSPLITPKVRAIAEAEPNTANYPQYTDTIQGAWKYFTPTTWTSGFFPSLLYLLDTRSKLCSSHGQPNWLALGRDWSIGLVSLADDKELDHDVGFLSYPFQQELLV